MYSENRGHDKGFRLFECCQVQSDFEFELCTYSDTIIKI